MNTKAKIYAALSLLISTYSFSQTGPGGVTTDNEIWLKVDNNTYIDAGTNLGTNGSLIQQWNDVSGEGNNALQANSNFRPTLKTNAINGYSALYFDGDRDGILASGVSHNGEVSLFVVLQATSLDNVTRGIIQAGPSGTPFSESREDKSIGMWVTNGSLWGRGIQSDNTEISFSDTGGIQLLENNSYVITQDYNGTDIIQSVNATVSKTKGYDGTLQDFSEFGIGRHSYHSFNGDIAEVILFTRSLNLAETTIVENYLSAKYGTALDVAKDFYVQDDTDNGNFDHNVAGIGQASDGSNHLASRGTGIVSMSAASDLDNSEYLFWGEDTQNPTYDFAFNEANNSQELTSKWRVSKTGDLGTVTVEIDISAMNTESSCQGLQLVVANNDSFTSSTTYDLTVSETTATATGVSFADGDYFTLSYVSDIVWDGTAYYKGSVVSGAPSNTDTCYGLIIKSGTDATLSADATVKSVLVEAGASLTIDSGVNLVVAEAMTLTSESDSFSSLILNGTITGTVNYERYVNILSTGVGGNDLISLPLMPIGLTFDSFITNGDNATEIADNGTYYAFAPYDNIVDSAYENFMMSSTEVLLKAKGYRVATNSGDLLTFTGTPDIGTITFPIVNPIGNEWNLIGNPYPSYVNADLFLNESNSELLDASAMAIYAYNSGTYTGNAATTGNFTIINKATIAAFSGENFNIAPGQGFFVAANATGGAIEFTPEMRTIIGDDDYIAGRTSNGNEFFKLNLMGTETYSTSIFFNTNASLGLDPGYDAAVYGINSENYPIFSHLVEDNTGRPMALQAIDNTDLTSISIPLGVNAQQGEAITFSIDTSNLSSTTLVYLEDTVANTSTLLNSGDYHLTPSTNISGTGRFYLQILNSTLSTVDNTLDQLNIYTNQADKTIVVAGQLTDVTKATIYDLDGRIVISKNLIPSSSSQAIDVSRLSTGVYVVELNNNTQNKTQKVILK